MKPKVKVSIPDPCTQIWDEMIIARTGKYCSECEKDIIDFTKMSSIELENWFYNSTGKICGRINRTQLEFFNQPLETKNRIGGMFYRVLIAACLTFIANLKTSASIVRHESIKVDSSLRQTQKNVSLFPDSLVKISGIIKDAVDKLPIPGTFVRVKNSNITTTTDKEGRFTLEMPLRKDEVTIVCKFLDTKIWKKKFC